MNKEFSPRLRNASGDSADLPRFGAKMRGDSDVDLNFPPDTQTDEEKQDFINKRKHQDALDLVGRHLEEKELLN